MFTQFSCFLFVTKQSPLTAVRQFPQKFRAEAARSGFIREACFSVVEQTVVILRKKLLQRKDSEAFYKIFFSE
jgi:hypothetical protein